MKLVINSDSSLGSAIGQLQKLFAEKRYVVATLKTGRDRTLDQNRLWFGMYKRIAQVLDWHVEDARRYCKLHIGVPIMRAASDDFRQQYDGLIRPMEYERKLELMGSNSLLGPEGFPVTRLFDRAQGIEYTEAIAAEFAGKGVFFDDMLDEVAA